MGHLVCFLSIQVQPRQLLERDHWQQCSIARQVLLNFLVNAGHALKGKDAGRIEVATGASNGRVFVSVCDNGPGIPDSMQETIFEPFITTKPAGEGTGLGLWLSRAIVDEDGGEIALRSKPGDTLFSVYLPAARDVPTAE